MTDSFACGFRPGALPGAVPAEGLLSGSDAHYGQPVAEHRALSAGRAFAVLGHRAAVRVTGEDRLSWLHSLMSQDMQSLEAGSSRRGLFLTAQGRIEFDVDVVASIDSVYLLTRRQDVEALAAFLCRMRFMLRVDVEDLSCSHTLVGFASAADWSDRARDAVRHDAVVVFKDPWRTSAAGGFAYTTPEAVEHLEETGYSWKEALVPNERLDDLLEVLRAESVSPAGAQAVEALRVFAFKPLHGAEADDKAIPHELDLLRTSVHLAKGCYKGQETIARVHNLGHPPRRLVFLYLDGSGHTLPEPGDEVFLRGQEDGRPAGRLTSVAMHSEAGPIGLAVLKRNTDPDSELTVVGEHGRTAARQLPVVSADSGSVVGRPRGVRRLS